MAWVLQEDQPAAPQPTTGSGGGKWVLEEDKPKSSMPRLAQEALGVARGIADLPIGLAQGFTHSVEENPMSLGPLGPLAYLANKVAAPIREKLGLPGNAQQLDKVVADLEQKYQEATPEGSGLGRVAGNLLTPAPVKGIGVGQGVLNTLAKGAQQGAVGAALQPVVAGEGDTYAGEKAKQVAMGAGLGGALSGVANAVGKAVSPLFQKFIKEPISDAISGAVTKGVQAAENPKLAEQANALVEQKFAGVDWSTVPKDIRTQLTKMAEDATSSFQAMTPEALARAAEMKALPVPIQGTKGQLTKDFTQSQFERETAKSTAGAPLREKFNEQNSLILKNFDSFIDETGGALGAKSDLGRSVVDPIVQKAKNAKGRIRELYDAAKRDGDMSEPVDVQSLLTYVSDHSAEAINAPVISTVGAKLQKLGAAAIDKETGELVSTGKQLTINDLEEVRKMINRVSKAGTPDDVFGRQMKEGIDTLTEDKGGTLYKMARAERVKYAKEFENQSAVRDLMKTKPGTTDRAVAYEDVWNKTVLSGSKDDLLNLRRTLMTGGAKGGDQAWRDLRAATVDYLKQGATNNMQIDELGNRVVSPAGIQKAIKSIGDEKLNVLFGVDAANKLRNLQSVIETLKVAPPGSVNTSGTSSAILNALDRIVGLLPVGGNLARGTIGMAKRAADEGASSGKVNEALNPISSAGTAAASTAKKQESANYLDELRLGRLAAVPAGDSGRKRR